MSAVELRGGGLSELEAENLASLERTIERGRQAFVDVANALLSRTFDVNALGNWSLWWKP